MQYCPIHVFQVYHRKHALRPPSKRATIILSLFIVTVFKKILENLPYSKCAVEK